MVGGGGGGGGKRRDRRCKHMSNELVTVDFSPPLPQHNRHARRWII